VLLHCSPGNDETLGDGGVAASFGHQSQHLLLPCTERAERVGPSRHQELGDDLRIENGAACGDRPQGINQRLQGGDAVLEQISHAASAVGQQDVSVGELDIGRQHQDPQLRLGSAGLNCRPQPVIGHVRRHPYVHDRHVRPLLSDGPQEAGSILDCSHDIAAGFGQQPDQTLAEQHGVIGHHHSHAPYAARPACQRLRGL